MIAVRRYWLWFLILLLGLAALLVGPGGLAQNSRRLVHGLCAQTTTHTFIIGDHLLPFDARMTGIYAGAGLTLVNLAWRGRLLCDRLPHWQHLFVLAFGFVTMAADGLNSFLTDIGAWHPWQTTNMARLVTGYAAGVAITVAMVWLLSGTVYQISEPTASIREWTDLAICAVGLPALWLVVRFAPGWAYGLIAVFLVGSAWVVVSVLVAVTGLLLTRRDDRIVERSQLHIPGAIGMLVALVVIAALALGRVQLGRQFGIPSPL